MSSEFSGGGFEPFPNTYSDRKEVSSATEWDDARIEYKIEEYWAFLRRSDIMPRATQMGYEILNLLGFEIDERYKERGL